MVVYCAATLTLRTWAMKPLKVLTGYGNIGSMTLQHLGFDMTIREPQDIENRRLALQANLDARKSQQARNELGQFATPTSLARDILAYSVSLLPQNLPIRFLDPAIGTGAFYSALLATAPHIPIERAEGVEIDPHYEAPARDLWLETSLHIRQHDFTTLSAPKTNPERFNLLVCNPPYVRHHHLLNEEKRCLQHLTKPVFGTKIDGLAGLYCYFLALSHSWMQSGADPGTARRIALLARLCVPILDEVAPSEEKRSALS